MIKLLLTGGGGAGNEALWSLLNHKYELHFADADRDAIDPVIPVDRRHEIPFARDPQFLPGLRKLCESLAIDLLVPGVDEELLSLAVGAEAFLPTRIMVPRAAYVETMLDKLAMVETLGGRGVAVPRSVPLADGLHDFAFPCICKPRTGRGSRNVSVLQNAQEARNLAASLGDAASSMMMQEKIEGTEYTVQMAADADGTLRAIVPVKVGIKRGITLRASTDADPRVMATCRAIHEAVPTSGCYNIQLILTADGMAIPFEINPRVSTTLCLVVASGVDPFSIYLGQPAGDGLQTFASGLHLQRHWRNHFERKTTDEI